MAAGVGTLMLKKEVSVTGDLCWRITKTLLETEDFTSREAGLTRVIAATHFYMRVVYTEDPSAWVAHIGGSLNVHHVGCARAGDVEVTIAVTSIETCLGRQ